VILNGKLVRSCTVKIRNVEQYSSVTTIEGIGTPDHLHPFRWLSSIWEPSSAASARRALSCPPTPC
jgi:hypothetical protein